MPASEELQAAPRGPGPGLGLGERLRSARKAKALSVQQVADALHLEEASVVALEEGRFEVMGAPVFVRGHLRRYACLVGLSPEAVLDAYRAAAPSSDTLPSLARPRAQDEAVRAGPWLWWLLGGLVLLGAVLALREGGDGPVAAPSVPLQAPPSLSLAEEPAPPAAAGPAAVEADAPPPGMAADGAATSGSAAPAAPEGAAPATAAEPPGT
jgi:cytoskeleton protein RodZ